MCLAIPVKIVETDGVNAVAEVSGVRRDCNVALVPDVSVGDYVLIHAGFAIKKWSESDVAEYNTIMNEIDGAGGLEK